MNFKFLSVFFFFVASTQAGLLLGKGGVLDKVGKAIGIDNLVNIDADARAKIFDNEIGIDGAIGIGREGIGAHASADGDVLGQKAQIHADILDGHKIDQHNHEVYTDARNRQYVLQRQYIGSKSVLVRKYLDNGEIYLAGANEDNELQHRQIDETRNQNDERVYDREGGYWDQNGRYFDKYGRLIRNNQNNNKVQGGWDSNGNFLAVDPPHPGYGKNVQGGWDSNGNFLAVDPPHPGYDSNVQGGWDSNGNFLAVDPARPSEKEGNYRRTGQVIKIVRDSSGKIISRVVENDDSQYEERR